MIKKIIVLFILVVVGIFLIEAFSKIPFGVKRSGVSDFYLIESPQTNKVANVVTSIVVNFRGFDTLGEVTVLFLAATGLGSIMYRRRKKKLHEARVKIASSRILQIGAQMIFPVVILLGAYIFIHGHLTPGGGFQGGVIIATGFLLLMISYRGFSVNHRTISWIESLAGMTFVGFGLIGLIKGTTFLQNFLPTGELNNLISGGIIGIIYVAVGFKVASELTGALDTFLLNNKQVTHLEDEE